MELKKKHLRLKFKSRLFLSVASIFLLLSLFVSFLFSMTSIKNARENEKRSSAMVIERISSQVESLYTQMDVAATSITKNSTLRGIVVNLNIREAGDTKKQMMEELEKTRTIQKTLVNMMFSSTISNVLLYNRELDYFYYTGIYLHDKDYVNESLSQDKSFELLMKAGTDQLYLGPHLSPWTREDKVVLSVLRNFSDASTTQNTMVEVQVPYSHLSAVCRQDSFGDEKQIVLLDQEYRMVYPYGEEVSVIPASAVSAILENVENGQMESCRDDYAYYGKSILQNRFHVLLLSNQRSLKQYRRVNLQNMVLAVLLILTASSAIIFAVISIVSKPLKQLIDYINTNSLNQDTPLKLSSDSLDEFELINSSFNQMLVKLKESIKQVYEAQIRETNANLAALQAQINPHFLYNALNSISAASEIYGSEVTTRMCQQFSSMMRYITSSSQDAKLAEEIRHTRNYLDFMKLSYDGSFDYAIDLPIEMGSLFLPRLTIEPLVENSFKHGFKECLPPWNISIACKAQDGQWVICIQDNGSGFSEKALEAFDNFQDTYGKEASATLYQSLEIDGLGLKNIYGRLFLYFHGQVDFLVENLQGDRGCRITIKGELKDD